MLQQRSRTPGHAMSDWGQDMPGPAQPSFDAPVGSIGTNWRAWQDGNGEARADDPLQRQSSGMATRQAVGPARAVQLANPAEMQIGFGGRYAFAGWPGAPAQDLLAPAACRLGCRHGQGCKRGPFGTLAALGARQAWHRPVYEQVLAAPAFRRQGRRQNAVRALHGMAAGHGDMVTRLEAPLQPQADLRQGLQTARTRWEHA